MTVISPHPFGHTGGGIGNVAIAPSRPAVAWSIVCKRSIDLRVYAVFEGSFFISSICFKIKIHRTNSHTRVQQRVAIAGKQAPISWVCVHDSRIGNINVIGFVWCVLVCVCVCARVCACGQVQGCDRQRGMPTPTHAQNHHQRRHTRTRTQHCNLNRGAARHSSGSFAWLCWCGGGWFGCLSRIVVAARVLVVAAVALCWQ